MAERDDYRLDGELMMLGAVAGQLHGSILRLALPSEAELEEALAAYVYVWADLLKSRYRLTITMDPEGSDDDASEAPQAADPQQPVA